MLKTDIRSAPPELLAALASFHPEELEASFAVSEWCVGLCVDASEALAAHLGRQGIAASVVDAVHVVLGSPHTVVLAGDHVIDYTFRQFHPEGDVPLVLPLSEFQREFRLREA